MNTYKKYKNFSLIFLVVLFIAFGLFSPINTAEAGKGFSFNPWTLGPTGGIPCGGWPWPTVGCSNDGSPFCSYAGPDGWTTTDTAGIQTVYAYGIYNTNAVYFVVWSDEQQGNGIWYPGTDLGGGTASADINLASHPGMGGISVHVQLYSNATQSWTFCDTASGERIASCTPVCGGRYECSSGTNWNFAEDANAYTWSCTCANGGATVQCSEAKPGVNGACAATHYNCSSGTLSTPSENQSWWWWWCIGSNGGSNSEMCSEAKACVPNGCAANTCAGQTCWNGCATVSGTKNCCTPNCNDSGEYCQGTPYSGNCGQTCTGTLPEACGGWGNCDKGCGGGTQTKNCVCPNGTETRICNSQPCPPGYREVTPW